MKSLFAAIWGIAKTRMKLHQVKSEPQNRRISNIECRRVGSLRSVIFYKIDRIPYFDIRYSLFDIRFFRVSSMIRLDARGQRRRLYVSVPAVVGSCSTRFSYQNRKNFCLTGPFKRSIKDTLKKPYKGAISCLPKSMQTIRSASQS